MNENIAYGNEKKRKKRPTFGLLSIVGFLGRITAAQPSKQLWVSGYYVGKEVMTCYGRNKVNMERAWGGVNLS